MYLESTRKPTKPTSKRALTTNTPRYWPNKIGRYPSGRWSNTNKPYAKSSLMKNSFLFAPTFTPNPRLLAVVSKTRSRRDSNTNNKLIKVISYLKKWLCIRPSSPPCFMIIIQGPKYKVIEKICPQRIIYGMAET